MKRLVIGFILIGIFTLQSHAQDQKYPKGAYMNFTEIVNKTPSNILELVVEKRTIGDIKMNGGNDFKLISNDESIKKSTLKKEILGYSRGDTLFLNCFPYKIQPWYSSVISDGKYLVFKGGISQNQDEFKKQMQMGATFGAAGGAIAGAKLAMMRFLYVVDKQTNTLITINSESLQSILADNWELLKQFKNEPNQNSEEVQIQYLKLLNSKS